MTLVMRGMADWRSGQLIQVNRIDSLRREGFWIFNVQGQLYAMDGMNFLRIEQ